MGLSTVSGNYHARFVTAATGSEGRQIPVVAELQTELGKLLAARNPRAALATFLFLMVTQHQIDQIPASA